MNRPYKQQRGISLASVLIGLAISSGLTLSLTQTFIMAKQSYQMATNLNDMNARALDAMQIFHNIFARAGEGAFQGNNNYWGSLAFQDVAWGNNGTGGCGASGGKYGDNITTSMYLQTPTWISPAGVSYSINTNVLPVLAVKGACAQQLNLSSTDAHTLIFTEQNNFLNGAIPLVSNVDFLSTILGEMDHNAGVSRWVQVDTTQNNGYNIDFNRIVAIKVAFALRSRDEILKTPAANVPIVLFPRDYTSSATTGKLCYCPDAGYCPCSGTATIPDRRLRKVYSRTFYFKSYNAPTRPPFCAISSIGTPGGRWVMKTGGVYTATNQTTAYGIGNWTTPDKFIKRSDGSVTIYNPSQLSSGETLQWATNGAERCALRYTTYNSVPQANQLTVNVQPSSDTSWNDSTKYFCRTWQDANVCMGAMQSQFPASGSLPNSSASPWIPGRGMNILNLY